MPCTCNCNIHEINKKCPKSICGLRCCHCRKKPNIPNDFDEQNIDHIVNTKGYNKWLKHSQPQESRKWFYWMTFHVDCYCWIMIIGNVIGLIVAHIIPILHYADPDKVENWTTCHLFYDENGDSIPLEIFIPCVLTFHCIEGTFITGMLIICIYTLFNWDYSKLAFFEKSFTICNILNLALQIYEGAVCWITFIRDSPWYQTYPLFGLLLVITFGVWLGAYIQYNIFYFLRRAENYQILYPKTENEIISYVRETYVDKGKIRVVGSKHSCPNSIYVDNIFAQNQLMLSLDHYTGVKIIKLDDDEIKENNDDTEYRAIVKGGTCLGLNRENPLSSESNGLVYILRDKGFALQDIGGVVQQTAAGFTAMGCAGGTIYHDYYESIYSIRIIDGCGNIKTYIKPTLKQDPNYDNEYWGC